MLSTKMVSYDWFYDLKGSLLETILFPESLFPLTIRSGNDLFSDRLLKENKDSELFSIHWSLGEQRLWECNCTSGSLYNYNAGLAVQVS